MALTDDLSEQLSKMCPFADISQVAWRDDWQLHSWSDGSTTTSRAYINTNGSTTWTAITTAA